MQACMNVGNHISDRSSTRIHEPPGGRNQMGTGFGWTDDPPPQYPPRRAPARRRGEVTGKIGAAVDYDAPQPGYYAAPQQDYGGPPQGYDQGGQPGYGGQPRYDDEQQQDFGSQQQQQEFGGGRAPPEYGRRAVNPGAQSSNLWASGASQNSGNMISDRSSTRIHEPPGGRSQMGSGFGWGDAPAAPLQQSRGSSRRREVEITGKVGAFAGAPPMQQQPYGDGGGLGGGGAAGYNDARRGSGAGAVSSNVWASGASQNSGNMISDRSSTRIHAPPGGHSSMGSSFGWGN